MLRILLAALTFPIFLLLSFVGKHFPHGQTFSPSLPISPSADMTTYYICSQHHILIQSECVMPIKKTGTVCVCHCMDNSYVIFQNMPPDFYVEKCTKSVLKCKLEENRNVYLVC